MSSDRFVLPAFDEDVTVRHLMEVVGSAAGMASWGRKWSLTSYDSDTHYAMTIDNQGTGGHLNIPGLFSVSDTQITGGPSTFDSVHVLGAAAVDGLLSASTTATGDLHVTGTAAVDTLLTAQTAIFGDLGVTGATALGDANTDTVTIVAITLIRNAAATATLFYADPGVGRVIIGAAVPLGTAANDIFSAIGGTTYLVGNATGIPELGLRYGPSETVGWTVGVATAGANADLLFKDDGGAAALTLGDASSIYQAKVLGAFKVTGTADFDSDMALGNAAGDAIHSNGAFTALAGASVTGGLTVTTGGETITAGGLTVTAGGVSVARSGGTLILGQDASPGTLHLLGSNSDKLEFFSTANGVAQRTITGVRTGTLAQLQTVVANLLAALAGGGTTGYGLVVDSTT